MDSNSRDSVVKKRISSKIKRRLILYAEEILPQLRPKRLLKTFPRLIQIETCSQCNGDCIICAYRKYSTKIKHGIMSMELFQRLIDEISEHEVELIDLFLHNEPLLDPLLIKRLKYVKAKVRQICIKINTNAQLLKPDLIEKVTDYVDFILVSCHGIRKETFEKIMPGCHFETCMKNIDDLSTAANRKRVHLAVNCVLTNKGGRPEDVKSFWDAKGIGVSISPVFNMAGYIEGADDLSLKRRENKNKRKKIKGCWLRDFPLTKIVIQYNGKVTLCCHDWERKIIMGDVTKNSILEIWNNENFKEARQALYYGGKSHLTALCWNCKNPYTFFKSVKSPMKVWYKD